MFGFLAEVFGTEHRSPPANHSAPENDSDQTVNRNDDRLICQEAISVITDTESREWEPAGRELSLAPLKPMRPPVVTADIANSRAWSATHDVSEPCASIRACMPPLERIDRRHVSHR